MPIDPSNRSGFAPNDQSQYPRNDTVPSKDRAHYPSTIDRQSSTKSDPHYKGDNARNIFPNNPPPYRTSGDRFHGTIDFGLDSDIWEYSDAEIRHAVQSQLAKKNNFDPNLLDVVVHRHLGKVNYDYRRYVQSTKPKALAYFEDLENEEDFKWTFDVWDAFSEDMKKRVPPEVVWIKDSSTSAHVKEGQREIDYQGKTLTYSKVEHYWEVERVYEAAPKRKIPKGMRPTIFDNIIDGEDFIFVEFPQELSKKKLSWNTMFTKRGFDAVNEEHNIKFKDLPDKTPVYTKEEFEKKEKYRKEYLDDAFDYIFNNFRTTKTKLGIEVKAPKDAIEKAFDEFDIPWAKLDSMSSKQTVYFNDKGQQITKESAKRREKTEQPFEEKELWYGNWDRYAWVIDDNEIRISKRK